jgi:thiamine transport system substrate-binding protein
MVYYSVFTKQTNPLKGVVNEMKYTRFLLFLLALAGILAACNPQPRTLTVMTHDSFAISEDIITQFEEEHNVTLSFVRSGDTGSALNQAILSKENPLADVFYGVDNTFLTRALEEGIFESYDSPLLEVIPEEFKTDPNNNALPVDYGDVCINIDKSYFEENNLAIPTSLEELTQPEYEGLLVTENPATSSPGLAFLMATIAQFGEEGYLDYWEKLDENGLVIASDWETAYYTNFSGSTGQGPQPMVVSYGSSPAAEVIFAETELDEAPTTSIIGPNTCFRQIEFVGILKGTPNRELAEAFIDFMLSPTFQEDIPLQMFVFPINPNAELPPEFVEHVQISDQPATLSPDLIDQNREEWIDAWTATVME